MKILSANQSITKTPQRRAFNDLLEQITRNQASNNGENLPRIGSINTSHPLK